MPCRVADRRNGHSDFFSSRYVDTVVIGQRARRRYKGCITTAAGCHYNRTCSKNSTARTTMKIISFGGGCDVGPVEEKVVEQAGGTFEIVPDLDGAAGLAGRYAGVDGGLFRRLTVNRDALMMLPDAVAVARYGAGLEAVDPVLHDVSPEHTHTGTNSQCGFATEFFFGLIPKRFPAEKE